MIANCEKTGYHGVELRTHHAHGVETNHNALQRREVKKWFGDTVHVRELNIGEYPYRKLFNLFTGIEYDGWILLEARTEPKDRIAAMEEQLSVFNKLIANAEKARCILTKLKLKRKTCLHIQKAGYLLGLIFFFLD